ncbi:hypothetical protein Bpfe_009829 [Biomphalaria pfeifferi]|uniref:Uncharacterized protein n=1 Tax=Biomphalaria pfeifferi TaxID=112525 RepID=A0AAD8BTL7_BIOPF|nr:hypothetical protein Bpfe_009829 [Biomphalaria pfeifferi]
MFENKKQVLVSNVLETGNVRSTFSSSLSLFAAKLTAQQLTAQQLTAQQLTAQQLTAQQLTAQQLTAHSSEAHSSGAHSSGAHSSGAHSSGAHSSAAKSCQEEQEVSLSAYCTRTVTETRLRLLFEGNQTYISTRSSK